MVWNRATVLGGGVLPAVVYATAYFENNGNGTNVLAYTVQGNNRAVFIAVHRDSKNSAAITGATLGGAAGTLVDALVMSGSGDLSLFVWLESALPSVNGNLNLDLTGAAGGDDIAVFVARSVDQVSPVAAIFKPTNTIAAQPLLVPVTVTAYGGYAVLFAGTAESATSHTVDLAVSSAGFNTSSGAKYFGADWEDAVPTDNVTYTYSFQYTVSISAGGILAAVLRGVGG